jgi:hypothetical protein
MYFEYFLIKQYPLYVTELLPLIALLIITHRPKPWAEAMDAGI